MFLGYAGLVLTYVILATMFLWMLRKTESPLWKKLLVIPLTLWWSIALYYTPLGFMGYPVSKPIPDKAIVVSYKIVEPKDTHKGGMYFWVIDINKVNPLPADPRKAFQILNRQEPRAYKLPYDRDLHKDLIKKKQQSQREGGMLTWSKSNKKQKGQSGSEKGLYIKGKFQVVNPLSLLPSKQDSQ